MINREIGYLSRPEQVEFVPGIFDLCRSAQILGYKLIVITNQAGIARGLYTEDDFHVLMDWMLDQFTRAQISVDGYYYCPHHPDYGIGRYRRACDDRKPHPGMILRAASDHGIDLPRSILIGDRSSDIQAGAAAGVGSLFLLRGTESEQNRMLPKHRVIESLSEVWTWV